MIFTEARKKARNDTAFKAGKLLKICLTSPEFKGVDAFFTSVVKSILGADAKTVTENADIVVEKAELSPEAYSLEVGEDKITVKASDKRGAIYALSTLISLADLDGGVSFKVASITDKPYAEIRGAHFYMPARDKIDEFKRIIDCMAFMKMNTVILEVGGGMEYERHPEINRGWEKFCKITDNMPGIDGTRSFQGADMYWKDSLHTELCGGSYLTKKEVRDIVEYCRERGMEVIPEVQALSHAYYLTMFHPEIAELEDDLFPDTYCPNNEESYKLYFEIAEEVLEVFEPKTVSIGHDEIRVMGWCDKCKDISAHELVGRDVCRLHDFYASHGVLPQENTVGSYYYINLKLKNTFETAAQTDNLKDTISYADIYTKVQEEMKIPSKLLEHVCERIALRLFNDFPSIEELDIELYKENPPMNACADKIGVSVHYSK